MTIMSELRPHPCQLRDHRREHPRTLRTRAVARVAPLAAGVLAMAVPVAPLHAQEPSDSASCEGRRVVAVEYRPAPPAVIGSAPGWLRPVLRFALASRQTDTTAVLPYVLLSPGETCSEFERVESERLLRAQPYLAEARVSAVPEGEGVRLVVETTDDIPLIIGAGLDDGSLSYLEYGSANLMGLGMLASVEWERGFAYREGFGAHFEHYHVLGGRRVAKVHAVRSPTSAAYAVALARPYLTAAQRVAWSAGYTRNEGYLGFPRPGSPTTSLSNTRELWGISGLARIGGRNRRLLAGASVGHERGERDDEGVFVTDTGIVTAPDAPFAERYDAYRSTSIAAIVGTRLLAFTPVLGLDSLAGRQDVASGLQLMTTLGWDLDAERTRAGGDGTEKSRQPFAVVDFYAGRARSRGLTALALVAEGQRSGDGGWDDVVTSGRLAWYHKPTERRTHEVSLEFTGAWDTRRPYRVTLANRRSGLRGYSGSRAAGGRLLVMRLEERFAAGGFGKVVGFGAAAFGDVGKLWAGDVPYGVTTSVRASVGSAFLVAVPRRSQGLYRAEVAARLGRDVDADKWTFRLARVMPYAAFFRESADVSRARRGRPAAALVSSP